MYLAWHAVHTPLEAPATWDVTPVPNDTTDHTRAKMNALAEVMDQGVGNVTATLREVGMWNNTLLVFQADNGGWTPTCIAAEYGHVDVVRFLAEHGAKLNQADSNSGAARRKPSAEMALKVSDEPRQSFSFVRLPSVSRGGNP